MFWEVNVPTVGQQPRLVTTMMDMSVWEVNVPTVGQQPRLVTTMMDMSVWEPTVDSNHVW